MCWGLEVQDTTRQDREGQDMTQQGKARQGMAWHGMAKQGRVDTTTRQCRTRQDRTRQGCAQMPISMQERTLKLNLIFKVEVITGIISDAESLPLRRHRAGSGGSSRLVHSTIQTAPAKATTAAAAANQSSSHNVDSALTVNLCSGLSRADRQP